ncbi:DNA repair protein REV1 [Strongyloides ratti]|uniref:DNA repair protein REV1 n=1 Tax=Strongyloides ratti TaxID=34506 RepID=A0A090LJH5_STRRB|nr:DNA repair protein REV1 [Strongyloides ratti]CEF69987.1 DNA repair protein REV1 [Strongyloides ratti]
MSLNETIVIDSSDNEYYVDKISSRQTVMEQWNNYMDEKIEKLNKQNQILKYGKTVESDLFKGLAISINGRTIPSFIELKEMFIRNGGEFHNYYLNGKTTCIVATSITANKLKNLSGEEYYVHPNWVVDSINQKKLKDFKEYLIIKNQRSNFHDARNPNFIENYYGKSRLHLISTISQEAIQWVKMQQTNEYKHTFCHRHLLEKISNDDIYVKGRKVICHIDMDCFFVSVGLINRPELIGKPVVVTHSRSDNSKNSGFAEIASCSYEARKYGLSNGMILKDAIKVCSNLVKIPYEFKEYRKVSRIFYETIAGFTLNIKSISCDEMYVDFSDLCETLKILDIDELIRIVRNTVYEQTKVRCSIGCGGNMLLARLATKRAKPNNQFVVENVKEFMSQIKVIDLPGVGIKVAQRLTKSLGQITTCGSLLKEKKDSIIKAIGKANGEKLYNHVRGIDDRNVLDISERKSVSCDINYGIRFTTRDDVNIFFKQLANELEKKLLLINKSSKHITLKLMIRDASAPIEPSKYLGHGLCNTISKSTFSSQPIMTSNAIFDNLIKCYNCIEPIIKDIRGIGAHLSNLSENDNIINHSIKNFFPSTITKSNSKNSNNYKKLVEEIILDDSNILLDDFDSEISDFTDEDVEELEKPLPPMLLKKYEEYIFGCNFINSSVTINHKKILRRVFITYIKNGYINKVKENYIKFKNNIKENKEWIPVINSLKKMCNYVSGQIYGGYIID